MNEELQARTGQKDVHVASTRKWRKWKWIGHALKKGSHNITRMAMRWNPQEKRKTRRPKLSWRHVVTKELDNIGKTLGEAKLIAKNREGSGNGLAMPWKREATTSPEWPWGEIPRTKGKREDQSYHGDTQWQKSWIILGRHWVTETDCKEQNPVEG